MDYCFLAPGTVEQFPEPQPETSKVTMEELNQGCNKSIQKQKAKRQFEEELVSKRINF